MKNSFLFIAVLLIITVNKGWADFNSSKVVFYNIENSYILYSHGNEVKEDYIWLKLAGDARKGQAISGDCDLLFGGNRKNNIINGKALHYETDISSNDDIQNVKAMVNDQYITFDNDEMFGQCGLNVVYGSFLRSKLSQKKYDKQIKEIIVDNLYDAKNNNNPNQRAFSNLVDNLKCSDILNNIQEINDIGFYLQQRKYSINSEKILKKVIACEPNRVVTYLNLGDALNDQSKIIEAKKYYKKYKEMMIQKKLGNKIPKRILNE